MNDQRNRKSSCIWVVILVLSTFISIMAVMGATSYDGPKLDWSAFVGLITDQLVFSSNDTSGEIGDEEAVRNALGQFTFSMDPGSAYDSSPYISLPYLSSKKYGQGIIIDYWTGSFTNDPSYELDATLCYAARRDDYTDPNIIDVLDTTDGSASEDTDSNINGGAMIPSNVYLFIVQDSDPEGSGVNYTLDILYHIVKTAP